MGRNEASAETRVHLAADENAPSGGLDDELHWQVDIFRTNLSAEPNDEEGRQDADADRPGNAPRCQA